MSTRGVKRPSVADWFGEPDANADRQQQQQQRQQQQQQPSVETERTRRSAPTQTEVRPSAPKRSRPDATANASVLVARRPTTAAAAAGAATQPAMFAEATAARPKVAPAAAVAVAAATTRIQPRPVVAPVTSLRNNDETATSTATTTTTTTERVESATRVLRRSNDSTVLSMALVAQTPERAPTREEATAAAASSFAQLVARKKRETVGSGDDPRRAGGTTPRPAPPSWAQTRRKSCAEMAAPLGSVGATTNESRAATAAPSGGNNGATKPPAIRDDARPYTNAAGRGSVARLPAHATSTRDEAAENAFGATSDSSLAPIQHTDICDEDEDGELAPTRLGVARAEREGDRATEAVARDAGAPDRDVQDADGIDRLKIDDDGGDDDGEWRREKARKRRDETREQRAERRRKRRDRREERAERKRLRARRRELDAERKHAALAPHLKQYGLARPNYCVDPNRLPATSEAIVNATALALAAAASRSSSSSSSSSTTIDKKTPPSPTPPPPPTQFRWAPYDPDPRRMAPHVDEFIEQRVRVTEERRREIATFVQGSPQWKEARRYRMGGSNFAAAVGDHAYTSEMELAAEMVDGRFNGNAATERGQRMEPIARRMLLVQERQKFKRAVEESLRAGRRTVEYAQRVFAIPADVRRLTPRQVFDIVESGANVSRRWPWVSSSSDGDIYVFGKKVGIIEIKTPKDNLLYPNSPAYYFAQVQGNMHVHEVGFCLFVCFVEPQLGLPPALSAVASLTRRRRGTGATKGDGGGAEDHASTDIGDSRPAALAPLQVDHYEYDRDYCEHYLFPLIHRFYFRTYLPLLFAWERTLATRGADAAERMLAPHRRKEPDEKKKAAPRYSPRSNGAGDFRWVRRNTSGASSGDGGDGRGGGGGRGRGKPNNSATGGRGGPGRGRGGGGHQPAMDMQHQGYGGSGLLDNFF